MPIIEPEETLKAIERVKARIEDILPEAAQYAADHFSPTYIVRTLERLSTDPGKVKDIGYRDLSDSCGSLSYNVTESLFNNRGIIMDTYISNDSNSEGHVYHLTTEEETEVLVDVSAGQFLGGHNHIFVGTRRQLRELTLNTYLQGTDAPVEGKYGLYLPWRCKTREDAFRRVWGDSSRLYPQISIVQWHALRQDAQH